MHGVTQGLAHGMTRAGASNAIWWDIGNPFRHLLVDGFLTPERYAEISALFSDRRAGSERFAARRFRQNTPNYDALTLAMDGELSQLFAPFFDPAWLSAIAAFFGIPFLPVVDGALHSSEPGSRTGWIHSDYCSAWVHRAPSGSELLFPDRSQCDYFTGRPKTAAAKPRRYIRAISLLFYLNNDVWEPGDGGETELLAGSREYAANRTKRIEPVNNRLLIFPCRRHSYHRFVTNRKQRNSLILWLHATPATADALLGRPSH